MIAIPNSLDVKTTELAELYREVSIAILNGQLPHGRKRQVAAMLDYHEVTFSLNLGPTPRHRFGYERAEEIAEVIFPGNRQQQKLLADYLRLAHEDEVRERRMQHVRLRTAESGSSLDILRQMAFEASWSENLPYIKENLSEIIELGTGILSDISRRDSRLDFVETCLLVADAAVKQNYQDQALFFALLAEKTLRYFKPIKSTLNKEREDILFLTSVHIQANALHHLKAYHQAIAAYNRGESSTRFKQNSHYWKPIFYRDKIAALSHIPYTYLRDIEDLSKDAKAAIQVRGDLVDHFSELLIDRAMAGAYLKLAPIRGAKRAAKCLQYHVDLADSADTLPPLMQVMVYRTQAQICWNAARQKPSEDWKYFTTKALILSIGAGMTTQLNGIQENFGQAVEPLITEIEAGHP